MQVDEHDAGLYEQHPIFPLLFHTNPATESSRLCIYNGNPSYGAVIAHPKHDHDGPMPAAEVTDSPPFQSQSSRRRLLFVIVLNVARATMALSVGMMPPLFPRLAESCGLGPSVYGSVLSVNCLVAFLATPWIGRHLGRLRVHRVLLSATAISGIAGALCGSLPALPSVWSMVVVAVLLKAVQAAADAALVIILTSYAGCQFPEHAGLMFALQLSVTGLAKVLGPSFGGLLFDLRGFPLPFIVAGSLHAVITLALYATMDKASLNALVKNQRLLSARDLPAWNLLILPCSVFVVSSLSDSFLTVTMEAKLLRRYNISMAIEGLVFGIGTGCGSLLAPLVGYMCDRVAPLNLCIALLASVAGVIFLYIGTFSDGSLLPLWTLLGALLVRSIVSSSLQTAAMTIAMRTARNHHFIAADPPVHEFKTNSQDSDYASDSDDAVRSGNEDLQDPSSINIQLLCVDQETPAAPGGDAVDGGRERAMCAVSCLWSTVSGAARFVSRVLSGILVQYCGMGTACVLVASANLSIVLVAAVVSSTSWTMRVGRKNHVHF